MLSFLNTAYAFILQHQILAWIIVWALVLPLLRKRTPAEWISLGERKPRVQGLFRAMRGAGFDPAKVLSGLIQFLTGRVRDAGLEGVTPAEAAALARQNLSDASKSKPRIPPLPLLLVLALTLLPGCYHRDGRAFTGPEYAAAANQVWKFTLAAAHAACDVIDSPAGDAASVMIQGAAVPIAVARGACGLYNAADPRAVGVLVHSDGTGHVMGGAS
jgi:hypothetical protein